MGAASAWSLKRVCFYQVSQVLKTSAAFPNQAVSSSPIPGGGGGAWSMAYYCDQGICDDLSQ